MQIAALLAFLAAHDRAPAVSDPRERHLRAPRDSLRDASLRRAHENLTTRRSGSEVAAMIRRWIEGQTFAPAGTSGLQVFDAQAARYGEFDEMFLVGLVEGEWPERPAKSIFYPVSLLSQLTGRIRAWRLPASARRFRTFCCFPGGGASRHSSWRAIPSLAPACFLKMWSGLGCARSDRHPTTRDDCSS